MVAIICLLICLLFLPMPLERWTHTRIMQEQPDHAATTLLVIGDSTSIQYRTQLKALLEGCLIVLEPTTLSRQSLIRLLRGPLMHPVNAKSSHDLRDNLPAWLAGKRFDIILVNVGLHDVLKPVATNGPGGIERRYRENLGLILEETKRHSGRVLFHSSIPLSAARLESERKLVTKLNTIASNVAASLDVQYIDVNQDGMLNAGRYTGDDGIHLSGDGNREVARVLASEVLGLKGLSKTRSCRGMAYE